MITVKNLIEKLSLVPDPENTYVISGGKDTKDVVLCITYPVVELLSEEDADVRIKNGCWRVL